MALAQITRSYGTAFAGYQVRVTDSSGDKPALYGTAASTKPFNKNGVVVLDSTGAFNVYVPNDRTYGLTLYNAVGNVVSSEGRVDPNAAAAVSVSYNPATGVLSAGGTAYGVAEVTPYVNLTATGTAFTGPCELAGFDCTVAAGSITIYDNTSAAGVVIVPATALTVGRTEFVYKRALGLGCHVVLSGAATVNVLVG